MTEHTCQLICGCNDEVLIKIIRQWWKELKYSKKELIEDTLPKRFYCNFRIGHYRGEDRAHFEFKIEQKNHNTILNIYMLYPEWSPLYPFDMFQEIVCWYISVLKERKVTVELKQGMLSRKIEC
jgi:hypothetical protein